MALGALAPDTLAASDIYTGIAALKNGSSKLDPPVAGLRLAAPSLEANVKSPLRVAEAPALVTAKLERSPSVAIATPNFPRRFFFIIGFPPKESESCAAKKNSTRQLPRANPARKNLGIPSERMVKRTNSES